MFAADFVAGLYQSHAVHPKHGTESAIDDLLDVSQISRGGALDQFQLSMPLVSILLLDLLVTSFDSILECLALFLYLVLVGLQQEFCLLSLDHFGQRQAAFILAEVEKALHAVQIAEFRLEAVIIFPALDGLCLKPLLDYCNLLVKRYDRLIAVCLVLVKHRVQLVDFAVGFHLVHDISPSVLV